MHKGGKVNLPSFYPGRFSRGNIIRWVWKGGRQGNLLQICANISEDPPGQRQYFHMQIHD